MRHAGSALPLASCVGTGGNSSSVLASVSFAAVRLGGAVTARVRDSDDFGTVLLAGTLAELRDCAIVVVVAPVGVADNASLVFFAVFSDTAG